MLVKMPEWSLRVTDAASATVEQMIWRELVVKVTIFQICEHDIEIAG